MSVISRSSRRTSCLQDGQSAARARPRSLTRSRVSTAERIEVSGFLISCATSAAKRSMASIRSDRASVMSSSDAGQVAELVVAAGEVGQGDGAGAAPAAPGRRRAPAAAPAGRSAGCSSSDDSRVTAMAIRMKGIRARRSARDDLRRRRWPPASARRAPPATCWIGIETETTRSPFSARAHAGHVARRAGPASTSAPRPALARSGCRVAARARRRSRLSPASPAGALAGGSGLPLDPVGDPVGAVGDQHCPSASNSRARWRLGDGEQSAGCRWRRSASSAGSGSPTRGGLVDARWRSARPGSSGCRCARLDQAAAQLVQHQGAGDQDRQAEQVQRDDQPAEPRPGQPAEPRRRGRSTADAAPLRFRGSGSRRHTGFRSRRTRGRPRGTSCACA